MFVGHCILFDCALQMQFEFAYMSFSSLACSSTTACSRALMGKYRDTEISQAIFDLEPPADEKQEQAVVVDSTSSRKTQRLLWGGPIHPTADEGPWRSSMLCPWTQCLRSFRCVKHKILNRLKL